MIKKRCKNQQAAKQIISNLVFYKDGIINSTHEKCVY